MSRARNWCLTSYKELKAVLSCVYRASTREPPSCEGLGAPRDENTLTPDIRYLIVGCEICPDTKREHLQMYVEFTKPMRLAAIKKLFNDKAIHCETRKGPREKARDYCKKEGSFTEIGEWDTHPGTRTDLNDIAAAIVNGESTIKNIVDTNPGLYCRYRGGLKELAGMAIKEKTKAFRHVETTYVFGKTGTGKTRWATEFKEDFFLIRGSGLDWFDGYNGEDLLIIDEYNNNKPIDFMLSLLDGYQLRLPIKGSFAYAQWTKIIITSNLDIEELHTQANQNHRDALFRRLTSCYCLD